jgi:hypothetical protein
MPIFVPPSRFHNVTAFFSGHYGFNVQAICDHECRFLSVAIAAPGGQPDITAFRRLGWIDMLRKLPLGFISLETMPTHPLNGSCQSLVELTGWIATTITPIFICRNVGFE